MLDVPLLFETGSEVDVDVIVVVTAPSGVQRQRVLSREGMSEAKFAAILERQMADVEKRRRAHFIVEAGNGFEATRRQIRILVSAISGVEGINKSRVGRNWR